MSKYGVFLVRIFQYLLRKSPYSVQIRKNADQKKSAFGLFSRSVNIEMLESFLALIRSISLISFILLIS